MTDHMEELLKEADALSFAVIVPTWERVAAWQRLKKSPFCRRHFEVAAESHVFCDGNQHQKDESSFHRPSSYGTTVFFLQNSDGAEEWPVTDALEQQLARAMGASSVSGRLSIRQYEVKNRGVAKPSVLPRKKRGGPAASHPAAGAAAKKKARQGA